MVLGSKKCKIGIFCYPWRVLGFDVIKLYGSVPYSVLFCLMYLCWYFVFRQELDLICWTVLGDDLTCWCTFSGYWWVNFVATLSQHEALPCERLTQGGEYRGMAVQVGEWSIHAGGHVTLCKRLLQKINMKAEISVDDNHYDSPMRSTWPQNISSWN